MINTLKRDPEIVWADLLAKKKYMITQARRVSVKHPCTLKKKNTCLPKVKNRLLSTISIVGNVSAINFFHQIWMKIYIVDIKLDNLSLRTSTQ